MPAEVLVPTTARPTGEQTHAEGLPPADQRGELTLHPRVVTRLASRSIELHGSCPAEPEVDVLESAPDHLELAVSLVLVYPDEPLAPSMNRLREQVAADLERQTGRPVRRLDLRVERFAAVPRTGRRVE